MIRLTTRAADAAVFTRVASVAATATPNVFQATLSTNADVRRAGFVERLGRWNAFPARVPLLDSHRRESVESVVGYADNIHAENGNVVADLHISETRATIATLMREGALNNVSIGFSAESWRDATEGGERVRIGEGLTLREASVVVIGADPGARTRGDESTADRIRDLAETLRVPTNVAEELVTRNLSFDDARGELVRAASQRNQRIDTRSVVYSVTDTAPADHARALGQALAARLGAGNAVSELGRAFTQDRFPQLARRLLEVSSISTVGLSEAAIVKRVLTTSDFPIMMGEFLNVTLMAGYRAAPSPLMGLVRDTTVTDFRDVHLPRLSQSPLLEPILETGEVSFGALQESEESFKVTRWGKGLMVSFVLLVNDRLGAITDQIRSWGASVSATEAREIDRYLTMNGGLGPSMADGLPLFNAAHGNLLLPPSAPSEESFDQARVAMRRMQDRFGQLLGLTPVFVLVPPELETLARKLTATIQATITDDVNVFSWTVLVDSRLTDPKRWYVFADPNAAPVFMRATLSSFESPVVQSQVDFMTDNVVIKCTHNFGFGVVDYVGAESNAGV
jgi:prohead serine protease